MNREILKKIDEKFKAICENGDEPHPVLKAGMLGVAEGFLDGTTIIGAAALVTEVILLAYIKAKKD